MKGDKVKGNIEITVKVTREDRFPITETFTMTRDNTYESLSEWVEAFKNILFVVGFHPDSINEALNISE